MMDGYGDEHDSYMYDSDAPPSDDDMRDVEELLYSQIHYDTPPDGGDIDIFTMEAGQQNLTSQSEAGQKKVTSQSDMGQLKVTSQSEAGQLKVTLQSEAGQRKVASQLEATLPKVTSKSGTGSSDDVICISSTKTALKKLKKKLKIKRKLKKAGMSCVSVTERDGEELVASPTKPNKKGKSSESGRILKRKAETSLVSDVIIVDDSSADALSSDSLKDKQSKKLKTVLEKKKTKDAILSNSTISNKNAKKSKTDRNKATSSIISESSALEMLAAKPTRKRKTRESIISVRDSDSDHGPDESVWSKRICISDSESDDLSDLDTTVCAVNLSMNVRDPLRAPGARDERTALKETLDSLPECDWTLISRDSYPTLGVSHGRRGVNRYYAPSPINVMCHNCKERGHLSKCCPKPRRLIACIWCGRRGHKKVDCDRAHCRNCHACNHARNECPFPRSNRGHECRTCRMRGHSQRECPNVWRQFHVTTSTESLKQLPKQENGRQFCSNCSARGHFEHECREERMSEWVVSSYPFIPRYRLQVVTADIATTRRNQSTTSHTSEPSTSRATPQRPWEQRTGATQHESFRGSPPEGSTSKSPRQRKTKRKEKKKKKITDWPDKRPESIIYDSEDDDKKQSKRMKKRKEAQRVQNHIEGDFPRGGNERYGKTYRPRDKTPRSQDKAPHPQDKKSYWPFRFNHRNWHRKQTPESGGDTTKKASKKKQRQRHSRNSYNNNNNNNYYNNNNDNNNSSRNDSSSRNDK